MMIDHNELSSIILKIGKKLSIKPHEMTNLNELVKKIINRDLNYTLEKKEFDLSEPTLTSAFFINNMKVECDRELIKELNNKFDLELLFKITQVNGKEYELVDTNKNKVRVPISKVSVSMKEKIPFELFMKLL